jgi:hypothetical protein
MQYDDSNYKRGYTIFNNNCYIVLKNKKLTSILVSIILSILFLLILIPVLLYKIPVSKPKIITAEIIYRYFDFDFGFHEPLRYYLENISGNSKVLVNHPTVNRLYIDSDQREMLCQNFLVK